MSDRDMHKNFFGRAEVLDLLKRRVIDLKEGYRQNVALLGNEYVGKSAILQHFFMNVDDERVIVVYLDLAYKDFNYFFSKFIGGLLYDYSKRKNLRLFEDPQLLIESTAKYIPHTIEVIKRIQADFKGGKYHDVFLGLLNLPDVFSTETEMLCVLIFDEFQQLEEYPVADVFQLLGKKIMTQKRCFYIVSSSYPKLAQKILSEKLSLLFGNFEVLNVGPFDFDSSQAFVDRNLVNIKIGGQLRNFLTDFTGGHPLYLNLLCQEVLSLCAIHRQNEVYMPILSQAIENALFNRWGVISRHFELIINDLCNNKSHRLLSDVMIALSNGNHKIEEMTDSIQIKKNLLTQRLNRLIDLGIIIKNGNFHSFKDKLFKYWIKYVYQTRLKDIELSPDKRRRQFKEELNRSVESFKSTSRQNFSSRVMELLYCFDNESFHLNGRKYKLPTFRELIPLKLRNESGFSYDMIKAMTDEAIWFIVLKKENLAEQDVNLILKETKKMDRKPERCLIISLADMDKNARLKALQERCWIWDENELNTLLTLFDKPYITR
jgi:predicted transcriptional regulator